MTDSNVEELAGEVLDTFAAMNVKPGGAMPVKTLILRMLGTSMQDQLLAAVQWAQSAGLLNFEAGGIAGLGTLILTGIGYNRLRGLPDDADSEEERKREIADDVLLYLGMQGAQPQSRTPVRTTALNVKSREELPGGIEWACAEGLMVFEPGGIAGLGTIILTQKGYERACELLN